MRTMWLIVLAAALAFVSVGIISLGCSKNEEEDDYGGDDWNDFLDAMPDADSLQLTMPGSDGKGIGEMAWLYEVTVDFTRAVNAGVLWMLSLLDDITSYPPSSHEGDSYIWGPWDGGGLSPAEYKLTITKTGEHSFTYLAESRSKNSEDEWLKIWWGEVEASASTQRRGVGNFQIDYDPLHVVDPTFDYEGSIIADYDTITDGRRINVTFDEFVSEYEQDAEPVSGTYNYYEHADYSGEFLFDALMDLHYEEYHGDQYDKREHVYFNTRWQGSGTGRTDAVATGGDLPDIEFGGSPVEKYLVSECWDTDFLRTYFKEVAVCEDDSEHVIIEEGTSGSCSFDEEMPDK